MIRKSRPGLLGLALLAGCAPAPAVAPVPASTAARVEVEPLRGKRAVAEHGMVAAAHPLASEAGLEMLLAGGNAIDAAVAAAFAVGVVEPMMSGLGGGGSMLLWRQEAARADFVDFYASAPASPDYALREHEGSWSDALGVAVPGMVAGLLEAHERHGDLTRQQVLAPAIRLAEQGFPVGALLARTIADDSAKLNATPAARLFWPDGRPLRAGEWLRQPELAATLREVAESGPGGFYRGPVAREVVRILNAGGNPMTLEDLDAVRARWKRPVCGLYRGRVVLSAPPPQSGIQIVETLNLLEPYDLVEMGAPTTSLPTFTLLTAALRASTADRNTYVGDPAAGRVPITALASQSFAAARGVQPGQRPEPRVAPADADSLPRADLEDGCSTFDAFRTEHTAGATARAVHPDPEESTGGETTHLSVVDVEGNAVSITVTQGSYFGTGAYAAGTFFNSAMFLFSDDPDHPNALGPNRVPRSTTTPTMLLRDGRVQMVVGSPGGGRIPPAVVQSILYTVDYGLDPLAALSMPRINPYFTSPTVQFEQGVDDGVLAGAARLGYELEAFPPLSLRFGGVHLIQRRDTGEWVGAADPRRDGEVRGYE